MTATDNRLFFDSNIWLDYFLQSQEKIGQLVDSPEGKIFTSTLSFHEVAKILSRRLNNPSFVREAMRFMRENSAVVMVDEDIAVDSVTWCVKNKLSTVDSIIYQSALASDAALVTADSDFGTLPKVYKVNV
ncbi:MAG: PIN domain-containing protein [Candidatus Diapherotrites archaeon]|nr:PIN domain-containing protein [Candidatus Diapherotrites archaeon]